MIRRGRGLCRPWLAAAIACGSAWVTGCADPQPKYEPPIEEDIVCITAADFGVPPGGMPEKAKTTLVTGPSIGRFPTGVSVARIVAAMGEKSARRYLRIVEMPPESALYWMQLWDDLPAIREVTTLSTLGLDPRGVSHEDLLKESVSIHCNLCVFYARVEDTDADAELVGVIWDAAHRQILASCRAPVTLTDEVREAYEKAHRGGKWISEAEFRAEADLRRMIRDTMWDLVAQDQASPTTQPSPWEEYLPVFPRDYDRFRHLDRLLDRIE